MLFFNAIVLICKYSCFTRKARREGEFSEAGAEKGLLNIILYF
jgi:hypothetical protein